MLSILGTLTSNDAESLDVPRVAVTVTILSIATAAVRIVKSTLVSPARMVTVGGAVTPAPPLWLSTTTTPPTGAATLIVTVPSTDPGPIRLDGVRTRFVILGVFIVRIFESVTPTGVVAVIVAAVSTAVPDVVTVKFTDDAPAATVTFAGTLPKAGLLDDNVTITPPTGAAPFKTIVPVEFCEPPMTEVGARLNVIVCARIVRFSVSVTPALAAAVIPTTEPVLVKSVVTVNVAVVAPASTVTFAGTVAALGLPEVKVINKPPTGAGLVSVIIPTEFTPPTTVVGTSARLNWLLRTFTVFVIVVNPDLAAVMSVVISVITTFVGILNKALVVPPSGTVIVATATVAAVVFDEARSTVKPPGPAGLDNTT